MKYFAGLPVSLYHCPCSFFEQVRRHPFKRNRDRFSPVSQFKVYAQGVGDDFKTSINHHSSDAHFFTVIIMGKREDFRWGIKIDQVFPEVSQRQISDRKSTRLNS